MTLHQLNCCLDASNQASCFQRFSLASVSVDSQILAPLRNLLRGVPRMLRRHRLPTGEKGNEELRYSGGAGDSFGDDPALKYILLCSSWGLLGLRAGVVAPVYCLSRFCRTSISSTSTENLWKVVIGPPLGMRASGTQRRK